MSIVSEALKVFTKVRDYHASEKELNDLASGVLKSKIEPMLDWDCIEYWHGIGLGTQVDIHKEGYPPLNKRTDSFGVSDNTLMLRAWVIDLYDRTERTYVVVMDDEFMYAMNYYPDTHEIKIKIERKGAKCDKMDNRSD